MRGANKASPSARHRTGRIWDATCSETRKNSRIHAVDGLDAPRASNAAVRNLKPKCTATIHTTSCNTVMNASDALDTENSQVIGISATSSSPSMPARPTNAAVNQRVETSTPASELRT